ncbi:MAG: Serine/threonine-protein kinase PrkC [Planctomycetota bacterium]|jgi:serine/threonine-protein kinase
MQEFTPNTLSQRLVELGLVEPIQVEQAWSEVGSSEGTCEDLIRVLLRKELVTNFQIDRVLKNERLGYFYGHYKVMYLIGVGTFARVYRAVHRDSGRIVAVKVLRKRFREEQVQLDQFLREGRMGLKLKHPNIVQIYEVNNDPRAPYLVMEFVEGQTLREMMKVRKILEPPTALKLTADVANALAYALTQGITHRDLKLSNILIGSSGRAKLVDFGLASISDTSSDAKVIDSPNARAIDYAALERGTGVRKDDPRSDIYFLGCILYNLLSGKSPLTETRDRLQRLNITRFREIPPLGSVVPDLHSSILAICAKAMELEADKRYQTADEMYHDLRNALERLEKGTAVSEAISANSTVGNDASVVESQEGRNKTVMVIESKADLQDLMREKLKSRGYRVLVFSNPDRAIDRFANDDVAPAHCAIFSAPELGTQALDAFNRFATEEKTKDIPAILLVDRKQQHIIRGAIMAPHRLMLAMPLKVRELRIALLKLLGTPASANPTAD